ncbi:short-chain dehydrogenase/reductase family 16C member 6-like [Maniola hyperantus]|uniref:short-chain dehydrogenase/reductase family 16C member 6-like n=1 Tax=Aphantopus hyperantus TaxID=2795564 RepID=UPI001569FF70|nr:short-chain dehydrogenase/reductase family 16C member 6-like [Maniola hyperantus]
MSTETQEYMNGMRPGPLTREIPECMRDKYTVIQTVFDVLAFLMVAIGHVIQGIYRSIIGIPKKDLRGSIALVTGGGGGLGSLIALRLARLGCIVVLWDINKQGLEDTVKLVKGVGGKCFGYIVDLTKRDDIYRVAKQVDQDVGKVSLLINNAGVVSGQYLLDTPDHLIQRTFDVNILSHFWTVKAFLPAMIEENEGHIVTIASMAGHVGVAKLVDYCSSKSAACGFDEALRLELEVKGVKGVHTSLICPYFIRATGMFEEVNSRFVPTLSSNEVADRVVLAIRTNEHVAVMPAYFRLLLPFKWIVPWPCISELIRGLVPDAVPQPMQRPHRVALNKDDIHDLVKNDSRPMTVVPPSRHERQV